MIQPVAFKMPFHAASRRGMVHIFSAEFAVETAVVFCPDVLIGNDVALFFPDIAANGTFVLVDGFGNAVAFDGFIQLILMLAAVRGNFFLLLFMVDGALALFQSGRFMRCRLDNLPFAPLMRRSNRTGLFLFADTASPLFRSVHRARRFRHDRPFRPVMIARVLIGRTGSQ